MVHLGLAVFLIRRAPEWVESGPIVETPLPVVFARPLPQIVPPPPTPPPSPSAPAPEPAPPRTSSGDEADRAAELARPRRPDLVFVIDAPEDADPAATYVAGTAGVSLPEVAPESLEEAERIGRTPRTGWVVLRVLVRRDGTAGEVALHGEGDREAATRMAPAVQALRFRPAFLRGNPVDAWFTMVWPPL